MYTLTTALYVLLADLLAIVFTPVAWVAWLYWRRHERRVMDAYGPLPELLPHCSLGYGGGEIPARDQRWIDEIETLLSDRSADG